jgi:hypothetical protein
MEISCSGLWRDMILIDTTHPVVIQIKNKISTYSKDDWKNMSAEAVILTKNLSDLVKNNVPADSDAALAVFHEFKDHFDRWFYIMDHEAFVLFALYARFDKNCNAFFNQFQPGLGNYMFHLVNINSNKITSQGSQCGYDTINI